MRVFVLVAIRRDSLVPHPPSVWQLQHRAQRCSAHSFRATSQAFLWTRDALFQHLQRVDGVGSDGCDATANPLRFWFFTALLDVGGCEEDVEVVAMVLGDLCRSWPGAAAHIEVCRAAAAPSTSAMRSPPPTAQASDGKTVLESLVEREETLLVALADVIEATPASQQRYIRRWGVETAWDYTQELRGRCWFAEAGYVAVLPASVAAVVDAFLLRELTRVWPEMKVSCTVARRSDVEATLDAALECAVLEQDLTRHWELELRTRLVPQHLYAGSCHRAVVAVPPTVALFLAALPSPLLHDCLLCHTHDCPLFSAPGRSTAARCGGRSEEQEGEDEAVVVVSAACRSGCFRPPSATLVKGGCVSSSSVESMEAAQARHDVAAAESRRLAEIFHEYDVLLTNNAAVRLPLPPVSRYIFTLLLCQCELPATLMAPFVRRHVTTIAGSADAASVLTEEEVVLGIKVTWAVQRWTSMLRAAQRKPRGGTAVSSPMYAQWQWGGARCSDGVAVWVQQRMRAAQQEVKRLSPAERDGITSADACNTTFSPGALGAAERHPALRELEVRLFAPRPLSFRGSSTEWLLRAVQEVEEQYAQVPSSLTEEAEVHDVRHSQVSLSAAEAEASDGSEEEMEEESDTEGSGDTSSVASQEEAASAALLEQMEELEAVLQRPPPHLPQQQQLLRAAGFSSALSAKPNAAEGAVTPTDDVSSWLTAEDMTHVSRNELFLQHVQLLGAELDKGAQS